MPFVKLNHSCSNPLCPGEPGDVIEVTDEVAQYVLERKGGTLVDKSAKKEATDGNSGETGEPKRKSKTKATE